METHDEDIPHSYFWRAIAVVKGIIRFCDGLFYHKDPKEVERNFHEHGELRLRSKGISVDEVIEVHVVEHRH